MANITNSYLANPQLLAQAGWSSGGGTRYATVSDMMNGGSASWGHVGFPGGKSAQILEDRHGLQYLPHILVQ